MSNKSTKELLKQPDEFMSTAGTVVRWIKNNPQRFISGLLIVVVISGAAFGWYSWRKNNENSAMSAFVKTSSDVKQLNEIVSRYSDTKAGKLSKLRLACLAFDKGNYDDGIKYSNEFIDTWGSEDVLFYQAMMIMASGLVAKNDIGKAVTVFDKCIENAPEEIKSQALYYKAIALKNSGQAAEAKAILNSMIREQAAPSDDKTKKTIATPVVTAQYREYAKIALADMKAVQGIKPHAE